MQIGIKNREHKRKGKLHYNTKKYSNPFFQKRKKNLNTNSLPIKIRFFIYLTFFALIFFSWFLFYSKYFKITEIEINGKGSIAHKNIENIVNQTIKSNIFILLPKENLFFFKESKLLAELNKNYYFEYLNIKKDYPHKLILNYQEKEYSAIWSENNNLNFIDDSGIIITTASSTDLKKQYPVIQNNTEFTVIDNKVGVNSLYVPAVIDLSKLLSIYNDELKIDKYIINPAEYNSIKVELTEGPYLLFDISKNLERQVDKLMIVKNEKIKDDFIKKEYIDIRTGDQVYFR